MARDLVVKKNNKSVTITPYNTPREYFVLTIEDLDGYNHFVDSTRPYVYNSYDCQWYIGTKRDREYTKAMYVMGQEIKDYICSVDYNCDREIGDPIQFDLPDGRMVNVYHVNVWLVNSYYPPEVINAPTISKKIVGWWYFWDTRTLLSNGKTSSGKIVACQGK